MHLSSAEFDQQRDASEETMVYLLTSRLRVLSVLQRKTFPPGPWTLPLLGSVFFLWQIRGKRTHQALFETSKTYGNIFSFRYGTQLIVVLHGYDTLHQAFVKQADVFSGRPNFLPGFQRVLKADKGISFESYNHKWKTLRKFTLHTLRDFGVGKSLLEEKIMVEVESVSREIKQTKGDPFNISPLLHKLVGNILYGTVFGTRFDCDDPEIKMIIEMTNIAQNAQGPLSVNMFFPLWLVKLFSKSSEKRVRNRKKNLDNINKLILKQIKQHEGSYDENNIRDFVDLYIKMSRESKNPDSVFTKGNMIRLILELHVVCVETTSKTLDWVFLFMSEHPEVQKKCQYEIKENVGDRQLGYTDRRKLPNVEATLCEAQRLANIAPFTLHHSTTKNTSLRGYDIPKDTVIMGSLYSANLDPTYWEEPHNFRPDRFMDDKGRLIKNDALVPFSLGPRMCLGEPLARIALFLVFTNLLQRFSFERKYVNVRHSMELNPNEATLSPYPYKMRIKKR